MPLARLAEVPAREVSEAPGRYAGKTQSMGKRGTCKATSPSSLYRCFGQTNFAAQSVTKLALEAAKVSVYNETRPMMCFVCLGNENLSVQARTYLFYNSGVLSTHFKRRHLANCRQEGQIRCDLCQVDLDNKTHWQRHAYDVHGTVS